MLHTAVCPRDRAVMWVSVSESRNYLGSDTVSRKTLLDSRKVRFRSQVETCEGALRLNEEFEIHYHPKKLSVC